MNTTVARDARTIRLAALAGTVGPIWFWVTLITLALVHGVIEVSGHQLLRYGALMYIGFFAYGVLSLVFVWGLRQRLAPGRRATAATIFLTLLACGPLLGTFTMGTERGSPESWSGWLHFTGFLLLTLMPIIAFPLFGSAVWSDARWRWFGPFSVAWGALIAVVVVMPISPAQGYAVWSGPGSMMDIVLVGTWQIVASRRLGRLADQQAQAGQAAPSGQTMPLT